MTRLIKAAQAAIEIIEICAYWINQPRRSGNQDPVIKKILVLGYCGMGDMLFLFPMFRALKRLPGPPRITLLAAPGSTCAELAGLNHDIDEIRTFAWAGADSASRGRINRDLSESDFDAVLITAANPVRFFMPGLYKIPLRIGHCRLLEVPVGILSFAADLRALFRREIWHEEIFRKFLINKKIWIDTRIDHDHDIAKCLRLAEACGVKSDFADRSLRFEPSAEAIVWSRKFLSEQGKAKPLLGMSLGMSPGLQFKQWGVEKLGRLARMAVKDSGLQVLLVGSAGERPLAQIFSGAFGFFFIDALGRTSLDQMAALIKECRIFVANDTGPAKLAMALGVPTAIIWGPSDRWGGGAWDPGHATIHNDMPCSPCFLTGLTLAGRGVLNYDNCGHRNCLNGLSEEFALQEIRKILEPR